MAVLLVVAGVTLSTLGGGDGPARASSTTTPQDHRPSIAILAFDNLSPDSTHAFFVDGVQGGVDSRLSRIAGLVVKSRSSTEQYRERASRPSIKDIAADLNADFVLEGSARNDGDLVRLTVQLIQGDTDAHLWSEDFDQLYSVDDFIRIQAEITQRIAFHLSTEISPEELEWIQEIPTENLAAYESYIQGRNAFFHERQGGSMGAGEGWASLPLLEEAIRLDPLFGLAHALLALDLTYLSVRGPEWVERIRVEAESALSLAPNPPEARLALARLPP